jgi:hypothetical protein
MDRKTEDIVRECDKNEQMRDRHTERDVYREQTETENERERETDRKTFGERRERRVCWVNLSNATSLTMSYCA